MASTPSPLPRSSRAAQTGSGVGGWLDHPLSRRRCGRLLAATAGASSIAAFGHTTAAVSDAPVANLRDYPALRIVVTDTAIDLSAEIEAGRYLVTNEDQATLGESATNIILLEEGQSVEELVAQPNNPATGMPDWFTGTIVGTPIAPAGTTAQGVVDLAPGQYAVWGQDFQAPVMLTVLPSDGTPLHEPVVEATIAVGGDVLTGVPKRIGSSAHLWRVTATGDVPHRFQLYGYPEPITLDGVIAGVTASDETPLPDGALDLTRVVELGGFGAQSAGQTGWPMIDLEPSTYIAMCSIQEGEAGTLHGLLGETAVFTVDPGPSAEARVERMAGRGRAAGLAGLAP